MALGVLCSRILVTRHARHLACRSEGLSRQICSDVTQYSTRTPFTSRVKENKRNTASSATTSAQSPHGSADASDASAHLQFLRQFRSLQLPFVEWSHANHLRLASLCYLEARGGPHLAYTRIKHAIQSFNEANQEHISTGYHETMTQCWCRMVFRDMDTILAGGSPTQATPLQDPLHDVGWTDPPPLELSSEEAAAVMAVMQGPLLNPRSWQRHYTTETMSSPEARRQFAVPDVEPFYAVTSVAYC